VWDWSVSIVGHRGVKGVPGRKGETQETTMVMMVMIIIIIIIIIINGRGQNILWANYRERLVSIAVCASNFD
jgi:hypothetical protein